MIYALTLSVLTSAWALWKWRKALHGWQRALDQWAACTDSHRAHFQALAAAFEVERAAWRAKVTRLEREKRAGASLQ